MKTFLYSLVVLAVIGIFVFAFKHYSGTNPAKTTVNDIEEETNQLCYLWNTEAGEKIELSMDVKGDHVTGNLNYLITKKDPKSGPFEGTITGVDTTSTRTVDAIWNTQVSGAEKKVELKILARDNIANVGFGTMKVGADGVYVYADPAQINWAPNLQRTDCGDSAMR